MAAELGNQYAVKLKDLETKIKVYEDYCKHIAKGKDKTRWYYEDEEISLVYETLTHYFENEPEVFETIKRKKSENKGFQKWEQYCEDAALGEKKDYSIPGLNMLMRNKYGWDKEEKESSKDEKREPLQIERLNGQDPIQP